MGSGVFSTKATPLSLYQSRLAAIMFSKCSPARLLWSPFWLRQTLERAVAAVGSG